MAVAEKGAEVVGQAVGYGASHYGDHFTLRVQAFPGARLGRTRDKAAASDATGDGEGPDASQH